MNRYIALGAVVACILLSCERANLVEEEKVASSPFTGQMEQMGASSKTYLDEQDNVRWSSSDEVLVFAGSSLGRKYRVSQSSVGKTAVAFDYIESIHPNTFTGGTEISHNVAYYPFIATIECAKNASNEYGLDGISLSSSQNYVDGTFAPGANPMVAVTESVTDTDLFFKNLCGAIELNVKGSGTIMSITLQGNNNEPLAGSASVQAFTDGSAPIITFDENPSKSITIDLGPNGLFLDSDVPNKVIIVVPPTIFENGFTVSIDSKLGVSQSFRTSSSCQVKRSIIMTMPDMECAFADERIDLSSKGAANSYIVSNAGAYKIRAVKGNSGVPVGEVASVEVLWESFGTSTAPTVGSLVKKPTYTDGYITFNTTDRKGNALIAAKDASGKILWSWHIWLTDKPAEQVYYNSAGTMMDRNLGATSATPGDVGALGLFYQWGRKDPFLGSSAIGSSTPASSTLTLDTWHEAVETSATVGTIEYAQEHPTTFIKGWSISNDWYYAPSPPLENPNNTLWQSEKTIYDPCPPGYRVPDGGGEGVWAKALGKTSGFTSYSYHYDAALKGFNLTSGLGDDTVIWYPLAGYISRTGEMCEVGSNADHWTVTPRNYRAYFYQVQSNQTYYPASDAYRALGMSVRCCVDEISWPEVINDLAEDGNTANSYIVSEAGAYRFPAVQGNSSTSVGAVENVEVLWESFGTDTAPEVGNLIKRAVCVDGYITFQTDDEYKEGNALIAAKDAFGKVLWSWHIWMTDKPADQEYYNNAGTMMDRNLGATSATPGDVGALGLMYQWGRKDPFMGSSVISYGKKAASTITWPNAVTSDVTVGTIAYAQEHPTTFILKNTGNEDWYYTGSSSTDDVRWKPAKTIYDPCPPGYRVPDGGSSGIWSRAIGSLSSLSGQSLYSSTTKGYNLTTKFGNASTIWYPIPGCYNSAGDLSVVGTNGYYWSVTPNSNKAYNLYFNNLGYVKAIDDDYRANARSIRCCKERPDDVLQGRTDLSANGTANSYIVTESGSYMFKAVEGNSSTALASIATVDVLWETYGTATVPTVGALVKDPVYAAGYIGFQTGATFKEGNALIAAKDASGKVLWSWHIWMTDRPVDQVYKNDAGTMMDRNLGATSATPGDVGALGLLYQWGRKDPFLGSSSISTSIKAASTLITWPDAITSDSSTGTIAYAQEHPTTFIRGNTENYDWFYYFSGNSIKRTNNGRWQSEKTIYDPCPLGYRVPDGGPSGIWAVASNRTTVYQSPTLYDDSSKGINFTAIYSYDSVVWYPSSGVLSSSGELEKVGGIGDYWSVTTYQAWDALYQAMYMSFGSGSFSTCSHYNRADAHSVRCCKE